MSSNRQRPMAGAAHAAIFNTFRRFRHQVLYVAPPFLIAYSAMNWAVERYVVTCGILVWLVGGDANGARNEYLNSKPGRLLEGGDD